MHWNFWYMRRAFMIRIFIKHSLYVPVTPKLLNFPWSNVVTNNKKNHNFFYAMFTCDSNVPLWRIYFLTFSSYFIIYFEVWFTFLTSLEVGGLEPQNLSHFSCLFPKWLIILWNEPYSLLTKKTNPYIV